MSIARHHAEWLSLIEASGPFLSIPALTRAFPQGLEPHEPHTASYHRAAYEEWRDNMEGVRPNLAMHTAWIDHVLRNVLCWDEEFLTAEQQIPEALKYNAWEQHETVRPDDALINPQTKQVRVLVHRYPLSQDLEKSLADRRWAASPAARMIELLHATDVKLGLLTNGEQWMLVYAPVGEMTSYVSWNAALWFEEKLTFQAFRTLLSDYRLFRVPDTETLEVLLAESIKDQHDVTDQLGDQVRHAVEILIRALDRADQDRGGVLLSMLTPDQLYEAALTIMMRLVFLLNAEERKLLLLGDEVYDQAYAVSTLGGTLREVADRYGEEILERRYDAWARLLATFRAVYGGIQHDRLTLPAYGGSLFDPDRYAFLEGRPEGSSWLNTPAHPLPVNNRTVLHLLEALQWLQISVGKGLGKEARRLSFRALDIEQIGHVYEGLLDHAAHRAVHVLLGLAGSKGKEPNLLLDHLEQMAARGEDSLIDYLKDNTGRSESALRKALTNPGKIDTSKLLGACGNDYELYQRVLPYLALLRTDDFDAPIVILPGSLYVAAGQTRRSTGTHYTPRSMTTPIVQNTLELLVFQGPSDGAPPKEWQLRRPAELLDLKICDMAMGSGAFLVEACRYLAARLVEAWEQYGTDDAMPLPVDREEQLLIARRLIADRCLYGVDKNPLAVEMAKLSLWLITLDKQRPFTFLDHALRFGDSLVGVSVEQLGQWALHPQDAINAIFSFNLQEKLTNAIKARRALESRPVFDISDLREKAFLLSQADMELHDLRSAADMLVMSYLNDLPKGDSDALRLYLLEAAKFGRDVPEDAREHIPFEGLKPFHWELEFPEVFQREDKPGFDAFIGNPPFIGGQRISGQFGSSYLDYLKTRWNHTRGSADYSTYFFLRGFENLRPGGALGLIATNTIAQGDTREMGLEHIVRQSGIIYNATNNKHWPGAAAVVVNIIHIAKTDYKGELMLDDLRVGTITPLLDDAASNIKPQPLVANANKSFIGSYVLGMGFVLTSEEANTLIQKDPRNRDVLFPYLNGEDLNQRPDQSPSRWVINFFDWDLERAEEYPDVMAIVREKVKSERILNNDAGAREYWWRFLRSRPELYNTIALFERVLVVARVSKSAAFVFVPNNMVFNEKIVIFPAREQFTVLQSTFHNAFAWKYSSTLKSDLNYSPSDVFDVFPFPGSFCDLDEVGENYHTTRQDIMLERWEGLTDIYNRFHNPKETSMDIAELRKLHMQMDHAVAAAYGWCDLDLGHGFHETAQGVRYTVSSAGRRELLARLLQLNQERYEAEVRVGLHDKGAKKTKKKQTTPPDVVSVEDTPDNLWFPEATQMDLLEDNAPRQRRLL